MKSKTASGGFTLFELLIVLVILGIAAKAAIPIFSSGDAEKLDLAATEVASAIRFARAESVRRGGPIAGFTLDSSTENVTLNYYNLQLVGINYKATLDNTATVYHPIDKKPYALDLLTMPHAAGAAVGTVTYGGVAQSNPVNVLFNTQGVPSYAEAPSYQIWPLEPVKLPVLIPITVGSLTKSVRIDGSGRVTVQ